MLQFYKFFILYRLPMFVYTFSFLGYEYFLDFVWFFYTEFE